MIHTLVNHEYNGDGTKRRVHCCGCWNISDFGMHEMIICNECGEARMLHKIDVDDPDALACLKYLRDKEAA